MNEAHFEELLAKALLEPLQDESADDLVEKTLARLAAWRRRRTLWTSAAAGIGAAFAGVVASVSDLPARLSELAQHVLARPAELGGGSATIWLYLAVALGAAIVSLNGAGAIGRSR
jgi:hypothetical protein